MKGLSGAKEIVMKPFRSKDVTFTPITSKTVRVELCLGIVHDRSTGMQSLDIFTRTKEEAAWLTKFRTVHRYGKLGSIFNLATLFYLRGNTPHFFWGDSNDPWPTRNQVKEQFLEMGFDPAIIDQLFPRDEKEKE